MSQNFSDSRYELYPAQQELLAKLREPKNKNVVIESPTGTGKTRVIIEHLKELSNEGKCRFLIVVPKRVMTENPWRKEFNKWWNDFKTLTITGDYEPKEREKIYKSLNSWTCFALMITADTLRNDLTLGKVSLDMFDVIVFDEAHNVTTMDERGKYRLSIKYENIVLDLYVNTTVQIIGLTIPSKDKRIEETEKHLKASPITSEKAKAPKTITYIVKINSKYAEDFDYILSSKIKWYLAPLERLLGRDVKVWMLKHDRIKELLEKRKIPEEKIKRYIHYHTLATNLMQVRQDLWEGIYKRALEKLRKYGIEKILGINEQLADYYMKNIAMSKRKVVADLVKKHFDEGKKILVYAKYRISAYKLQEDLVYKRSIQAQTFMGGDPPSKLKEIIQKYNVVIATSVVKEGVDLPEFDVLIHISSLSSRFTREQIKGRIRGGEVYYVVFKDTNDEYKLRKNLPDWEGTIYNEVEEGVELKMEKLAPNKYRIVLQQGEKDIDKEKALPLKLPSKIYEGLRNGNLNEYEQGYFTEEIVKMHFKSMGKEVYRIGEEILKMRKIIGLGKEELSCLKAISRIFPPPFDLLVIGDKPLLIDVKSSFKIPEPSKEMESELVFKAKDLKCNFLPMLTFVFLSKENEDYIAQIHNRIIFLHDKIKDLH
jgi:superfamily II DNA or RNA helicase